MGARAAPRPVRTCTRRPRQLHVLLVGAHLLAARAVATLMEAVAHMEAVMGRCSRLICRVLPLLALALVILPAAASAQEHDKIELVPLIAHAGHIEAATFYDGTLKLWDAATGRLVQDFRHPRACQGLSPLSRSLPTAPGWCLGAATQASSTCGTLRADCFSRPLSMGNPSAVSMRSEGRTACRSGVTNWAAPKHPPTPTRLRPIHRAISQLGAVRNHR
jgi:hypothetical protein